MTEFDAVERQNSVKVTAGDEKMEWSFVTTRQADEIDQELVERYRPDQS